MPHLLGRLGRVLTCVTLTGVVLTGSPVAPGPGATGHGAEGHLAAPGGPAAGPGAEAVADDLALVSHRARHPHRKIKRYRVRSGDTMGSVASRFHAWTDQLVAINHGPRLRTGEVIRIPVVVPAARACTRHRHHHTGMGRSVGHHAHHAGRPGRSRTGREGRERRHRRPHGVRHRTGWHHEHASRAEVRRQVVRKARYHNVDPALALAVAWQESGWQQDRVSSAKALGAMQVLPSTARWMSVYVGRKLNPRDLRHNATAGVVLLDVLRSQARRKVAVAGYYQGLAGVRRHGMYRDTRRYVRNVVALQARIARGWNPAR